MEECEFCQKNRVCDSTFGDYYLNVKKDGKAELTLQRECDCEFWNAGAFEFNYCPMCGRKLDD